MGKDEAEDVASRRDGDVLDSVDCVGHWGSTELLTGIEVPERMARGRVKRFERTGVIAKEN